jgi:hypothetical protein
MIVADEQTNSMFDSQCRELNALALAWAERHVSAQTTYLHYNYHQGDEEGYQTIPVYENVLHAYALFKAKTAESVTEAKRILKGMLQFQNRGDSVMHGNFPVYLHEYPLCKDRLHGVHLLPVFYWILTQFRQVLGNELECELRERTSLLLEYCLKSCREKAFPIPLALKFAASLFVLRNGGLDKSVHEDVDEILKIVSEASIMTEWFSPQHLSDILIAFQMTESSKFGSIWEKFWQFLEDTYHVETGAYVGPAFYEFQWKAAPQAVPYHFYMSYFSGSIPKQLHGNDVNALYGALVQPSLRRFGKSAESPLSLEGDGDGRAWKFNKYPTYACSCIKAEGNKLDVNWKGLIPFKMTWGSHSAVHTLVAQGGNYEQFDFFDLGKIIRLDYRLAAEFDLEDKERRREIILAVDRSPNIRLRVNGKAATTFTLDDEVEVVSDTKIIKLRFSLVKGEGRFIGHLMPGNRASQLAIKNENRFNAYDTLIFIRTLRRTSDCQMSIAIECQDE